MARHKHHGGAWKVAYADFVTAMMALFLLLWLSSQNQRIKQAVQRAFTNPFASVTKESVGVIPNKDVKVTPQHKGRFDSPSVADIELLRRITEDLARLLKQNPEYENSVKIRLTPNGLRINVFDRWHRPIFKGDTCEFTDYGAWVFSTLAWEIARYPMFLVELEGHTEKGLQELRPHYGPWELSAGRATASRRELIKYGVQTKQISRVIGLADTQPMPKTPPTSDLNRRVTIVLKVKHNDQPK